MTNDELMAEMSQLDEAYRKGFISFNIVEYEGVIKLSKKPCKGCGHHYITDWKYQHNETKRHKQEE